LTNYNWTIWDKLMPQVISIDFLDYKSTINTRIYLILIYKFWLSNFLEFNLDMVLNHLNLSFKKSWLVQHFTVLNCHILSISFKFALSWKSIN
jgi:hypothetical protein